MSAELIYFSKLTLIHPVSKMVVICELKIWKVNNLVSYPDNIKYSLFCVEPATKNILIGHDNHFPKGHHKHINNLEVPYLFSDHDQLIEDFWNEIERRGFIL